MNTTAEKLFDLIEKGVSPYQVVEEAEKRLKEAGFEKLEFQDKLSYSIFECLLYSLINDYKKQVELKYNFIQTTIHTHGLNTSPLLNLKTAKDNKNFCIDFLRQRIEPNKFRVVIKKDVPDKYFSILYTNVAGFLNNIFLENEDYINDLAEVIVELVGNACEHAQTDCLLDIDVNKQFYKKDDPNGIKYGGINVVVLNFSDKLLGENLKSKCQKDEYMKNRYKGVLEAYNVHKDFFHEKFNYDEEKFYLIGTLQDKISGRLEDTSSGGTGLTKLLQSLQKQSTEDFCYLLSGENVFKLQYEYINRNDGNWVGFNCSGDFINDVPNFELFSLCEIFFPGTAYNLTFII